MIRVGSMGAGLIQRLHLRAERVTAQHLRSASRRRRGHSESWRSAASLWPDFTDDPAGR